MNISTFEEDLIGGLEDFSKQLEDFIATEHDFVEGSLVIALTSKYGSGKSTFLKMWKASIESTEGKANELLVVSLNAWESDYFGDPLFAIVSALVEELEIKGKNASTLINAAKDFGWFATAIAGQIVNKVTGIDAVEAGAIAEKKKEKREQSSLIPEDAFSIYQGRKSAMEAMKSAIQEFVSASEPRVLFLVDELDRCRPDYAISYLETIKHIFDTKGAVFLLAADRHQLKNSARAAFGQGLDFEEYYRKFIHREITLPPISDQGYKQLAAKYVSYYLEREGSRHCFMELSDYHIENISELIGALKLTPRQIQEVFRILGHIVSTSAEKKGRILWCLAIGSIAMVAFKVGNPRIFQLLGTGRLDPKESLEFIRSLLGNRNDEWWFSLFFTGRGLLTNINEGALETFKRVGLVSEEVKTDMRSELSQFYQGWGMSRSASRFTEIREKIEQISKWI